jgi:hypothetical protein
LNNKEFIIGKLKEKDFAKLFTNVVSSSTIEDVYEHWDLLIKTKIDVKSIKKESRGDLKPNENFHWVELKNVRGKLSWLYGKADFFSFETEDYWIIVEKESLQKFIEEKCKGKQIGPSKDPYELYQRIGRKDVIVKVKTIDLIYISITLIKKYEQTDSQK